MPSPDPRVTHATSDGIRRALLQSDREDLLTVLALRFASVPPALQARIEVCDDAATLERWILVAANVPDWAAFVRDLDAGPDAFRLVGASYEPVPAPREARPKED